jgi:signal transduction histidine kinase
VKRVLPHTTSIIALREGDELVMKAFREGDQTRDASLGRQFPISAFALFDRALLSAQPFVVRDVAEDEALSGAVIDTIGGPARNRAMIGAPLIARDRVIGVLALGHDKAAAFASDDLVTLQAFANQVAIAIENARLYAQSRRTATLEERARMARELHDSVTQSLHSIGLYADAADRAVGLGKMDVGAAHVHEVHQLAREAMHEMRALIFEMRPAVLEERGLGPALKARVEAVEARAGIAFSVETSEAPASRLPIETESELYRIAQEALTNVIKHARAAHVRVRLTYDDPEATVADAGAPRERHGRVVLEIRDDGVGFDWRSAQERGTFGLRSINERAAKIGGVLTIDTAPGQGTMLRIEVAQHGS